MTSKTVLLSLAALALAAPAAEAAQHDNLLLSRAGQSGPLGNGAGSVSDVSDDGRYVAFESWATNLVTGSSDIGAVFVRDTLTGATTLASRASGTAGLASGEPSISGNGRYVAFATSSPLVAGVSGRARPGRNTLVWRSKRAKAGSYALALTAVAAGRTVRDADKLKLTR